MSADAPGTRGFLTVAGGRRDRVTHYFGDDCPGGHLGCICGGPRDDAGSLIHTDDCPVIRSQEAHDG